MTDLSKTIQAKVDQLTADDLQSGSVTIKIRDVTGSDGEQPISIHYEGDNGKPWKPCKSMRRVLVNVWKADGKKYIGKSLTLFNDAKVKFGGLEVGGIRISHMSDITSPVTMALTASKANKKPFTVKPLATVTTATKEATDPLELDGEAAAAKGIEAFTEWGKSLTEEQKIKLKSVLPALTKKARSVDQ